MSDKILKVTDLNVRFNQDLCVKNANLYISQGETVALVGPSGSGKTTLGMSIVRLLPPYANIQGDIEFKDYNLTHKTEKELCKIRGNDISVVFQDPMSTFHPYKTIGNQIIEPLLLHNKGIGRKAAINEAANMLGLLDMPRVKDIINSYPYQLSGGQLQRASIAMALINKPSLLIADEPTTALDATVQLKILKLLLKIQDRTGVSILFITHNLLCVKAISTRVYVLDDGSIVESGNVDYIFNSPSHNATKEIVNATTVDRRVSDNVKNQTLFECRNLNIVYSLYKPWFTKSVNLHAVKDVSFKLKLGETLGIVGESGSGKTTLAKGILKLIPIETGNLILEEKEYSNYSYKQMLNIRGDIQVVFQNPYSSLPPHMNIEQIIIEGIKVHMPGLSYDSMLAIAKSVMRDVKLPENSLLRYPHEFSGGQRQRIAIARIIAIKPKLIILDEPTSSLDKAVQSQILDLLVDLQIKYSLSYILISHDLGVVCSMSNNVITMRNAEIIEFIEGGDIYNDAKADYTKLLIEASM